MLSGARLGRAGEGQPQLPRRGGALRPLSAAGWHFPVEAVAARIGDDRFHYALRHGSMKIGLYAPRGEDPQEPHQQDELYIIVSGRGSFVKNGDRVAVGPQDALFVEAGAAHRFEDFSDDFAAWVIFWGPSGGETDT
ncbi:cupin domain-containing protein [Sphingomonas koreensis]|nr:cupin domain-containing protein [Sphingomonas koreensis]